MAEQGGDVEVGSKSSVRAYVPSVTCVDWILGCTKDGTQAECVRIPQAGGRFYRFPSDGDEEALVMLSDILPTGYECGVLNGQVKPGDAVAIVGTGPVGLAVLLTAQFYSPGAIFMIDLDDKRLAVAKKFGATTLINSTDGHAAHHVMELTEGAGVDLAIEAVGLPVTFATCQAMAAADGRIANVGVHGEPVELHMVEVGFVSGHRFSDAVTFSKSGAPSGAGYRNRLPPRADTRAAG